MGISFNPYQSGHVPSGQASLRKNNGFATNPFRLNQQLKKEYSTVEFVPPIRKSLFQRVKEALGELMFEKIPADLPVGIRQLNQQTFAPAKKDPQAAPLTLELQASQVYFSPSEWQSFAYGQQHIPAKTPVAKIKADKLQPKNSLLRDPFEGRLTEAFQALMKRY